MLSNDTTFTLPNEVPVLPPLRGELFSIDHLRAHAHELAETYQVSLHPEVDRRFYQRFKKNAVYLRHAHTTIARAIRSGEPLTPDAEWLLDNFYVVEEQLHEIQDDLPPAYFRELPKVLSGKPRILQLAEELIIHTDSVVQQDDLIAFINEFQTVAPLTIGELWALPIMLRLALVENLRRLAGQMLCNLRDRETVQGHVRRWQPCGELPEHLRCEDPRPELITHTFTVLGDEFADDATRFTALEQLLMDRFPAATELIRGEHRRQAANQVSIGNVITSMRLISALDWTSFFEQTSLTERLLRTDPAEVYSSMDAESRDRYRHAVEDLSKRSKFSELEVLDRVIARATSARSDPAMAQVKSHVGYWLVDDGRRSLEVELNYRPGLKRGLQSLARRYPEVTYSGLVGSVGVLALSLIMAAAWSTPTTSLAIGLFLILSLMPVLELSISLANWLTTQMLPPRILPKLELASGVPARWKTFVVIPAMLTGRKEVAALLDRLEMHYVSNPEPELCFALLTDFSDSKTEHSESDSPLVEQAVEGIRRLNGSYGNRGRTPFYLFHRGRQWNEKENSWMGWERKRGKLMEFIRLLHGDQNTSYIVQEGDLSALATPSLTEGQPNDVAFPFVITLDADTQLPMGIARRLIGTMAHPLNMPLLNDRGTCLGRGYTILQPRVSVQLGDGNKSRFTQLFANGKGIDPYATAASDVYQDLFNEGSFTGKGIFDVRLFEQLLANSFGENQILSHDLIEGCHARVGLVTDIEVIDGFPARYDAEARRSHRWVRGDWQILPWLFRRVPSAEGTRPNRLSLLSRWKILDNLRRSLVAPASCLLLITCWMMSPRLAVIGSIVALLALVWPLTALLLDTLRNLLQREFWISRSRVIGIDLLRAIAQSFVVIACLPHKAYLMVDAITRTLHRMYCSGQRLLEWETAAATERRLGKSKWSIIQQMAFVPAIAIVLAIILPRASLWIAAPWLIAWAMSPLIAHWISQPIIRRHQELAAADKEWLRLVARYTWSYFETYVNSKTNWLPPDNFQEYPEEKLAERISPTNEGLFLVSGLIARNFGFVGFYALLDLWERNFAVWSVLPQMRGHFYNWYETSTLQPLLPRYISTVDSGNLAASLLVIHQGSSELCRSPVFSDKSWNGLRDTLKMVQRACDQIQPRGAVIVSPPLDELNASLKRLASAIPDSTPSWSERLTFRNALRSARNELSDRLKHLVEAHRHPTAVVESRMEILLNWLDGFEADFSQLIPWGELFPQLHDQVARLDEMHSRIWAGIHKKIEASASLEQLIQLPSISAGLISDLMSSPASQAKSHGKSAAWDQKLQLFQTLLIQGAQAASALQARCQEFGARAEQMALGMDFKFLYNAQRKLFAIGYNLEAGQLDHAHYDMLCSEARLSSQLAIAKGDVNYKHWFQLGRQMTNTAGQPGLCPGAEQCLSS